MKMRTVHADSVPTPKPGIKSNCKLVGNQFFISGMVGREADGSIPEGMGAQATLAFRKIQALAQAAGGKMSDVVQLNVFATELAVDDFQRVRREFFSGDFPCSTFVQVKGLADPRLVVEINATGFIGAGD